MLCIICGNFRNIEFEFYENKHKIYNAFMVLIKIQH